jgi:hypothetical protein
MGTMMKSPFPGMDPYLENSWRDVHTRLITYSSDQLNEQLPSNLRCRVEERVLVEPGDEESLGRSIYQDVRVVERPGHGGGSMAAAAADVAEPLLLTAESEAATETYLEIIDLSSGRTVITVIEFLSHSNKSPGPGQKQYRKKQREILASSVSLVEIDLLRAGKRIQACGERIVPRRARTPYRACVRRAWIAGQFEFYPIALRDRLPGLRIPLREKDADVFLRLQPLIEQCYRLGRYDDIDYSLPLEPPLQGGDEEWAAGLIANMRPL